ncbi:hypothetical protein QM797_17330 [Rhodococcus sp. IEGM 1381]|uniref:hypothetical protein n=1 Tax=Rhodococcus sp. IEGM 1381 TaxID=3047085 RepID=UPI0024B77A37|nr:hypothetical protein [Rhodococcus sp. IEGM 1381]MDI9896490.1 hypothetical protein [Rhodococcus sp. IEGM 1381]
MIGRRVGLTIFLVVTAALASYGVLSTPESRSVAEIGSADQFVCALPQDVGGYLAAPPQQQAFLPRPAPGTVPEEFEPVTAVVCDIGIGDHVAADGTVTYVERRYAGDFDAAVRELNRPPTRRSIFDAHCLASVLAAAPVDMWLLDADGRAVQPSYPRGDCGLDNTLGLAEILELPEVGTTEHQVRLDTAGIAYFFSCSPVVSTPTPGLRSLLDLTLTPSGFCHFDNAGASPEFAGADRYAPEPYLDWNATLTDLEPAGPCNQQATSLATTSTQSNIGDEYVTIDIHIELDGCRRILADGFTPLAAPAAYIDSINSATH